MKSKFFGVLQRVGRSFMLPIALLPVAGLLLGIGSSFTNPTTLEAYGLDRIIYEGGILYTVLDIMSKTGSVVFDNLALLFAMGVAIGMATTVVAELSAISPEAAAIGTQINTVVLCATLVYELLGPLLTKWALTKAGEINPSAVKEEIHDHNYVVSLEKIAENATAKKDITAEQPSSPDQADDTASK